MPSSLFKLRIEPVELDRWPIARPQGPGDSVEIGDGRGVISVIAASIGLESAEPGESEPVMLVVLRFWRNAGRFIARGAVLPCVLMCIFGRPSACMWAWASWWWKAAELSAAAPADACL